MQPVMSCCSGRDPLDSKRIIHAPTSQLMSPGMPSVPIFQQCTTLLMALSLWGCSTQEVRYFDVQAAPEALDAEVPPDTRVDISGSDSEIQEIHDSSALDVQSDSVGDPDTTTGCLMGSGCFGEDCEENSDCESGLCVAHMGNRVCTKPCLDECPRGWKCKELQQSGEDLIFACVSDFVHLCQPCKSDEDCRSQGVQDTCTVYGEAGAFCGFPCENSDQCPSGFNCEEILSIEGSMSRQCVQATGTCSCSDTAIELKLSAACEISNEFGVCAGERMCSEEGLGACDAVEAEEDTCDGVDNDCDGQTDEISCDDENLCTEDSCSGASGCTHTPTTGLECDDGLLSTAKDQCDALGNCVGTPIECPTSQCVDSNEANGVECETIYSSAEKPCDDGDATTISDLCDGAGGCAGTPTVCGDGKPEGLEECDDGNTNVESCAYGKPDCSVCGSDCFWTEGILTGYCGDGTVQGEYGEICDGDCPSSCVATELCSKAIISGSSVTCDLVCTIEALDESTATELCDGKDNDCDSATDEGIASLYCGLGECAHEEAGCAEGSPQFCNPFEGSVADFCDGKDNDCDGLTDEELGQSSCGLGECLHTLDNCLDGQIQSCDPMKGSHEELCDLKDNDCDGETDEGIPQIGCGLGECAHTVSACIDGLPNFCNPFEGAGAEICDGKDNNCDGSTDEAQGASICGVGACARTLQNCVDGEAQTCDPLAGSTDEICDGLDNDCDGGTDEDMGTIDCGFGACAQSIPACFGGAPNTCDPMLGSSPEVCNEIDDDCDGETDNGVLQTFWTDQDKDGYGDPNEPIYACAQPEGAATNNEDCQDLLKEVHPGAEAWHAEGYITLDGALSFDWNCNEEEERRWPNQISVDSEDPVMPDDCDSFIPGWNNEIPLCGAESYFISSCDYVYDDLDLLLKLDGGNRAQECR